MPVTLWTEIKNVRNTTTTNTPQTKVQPSPKWLYVSWIYCHILLASTWGLFSPQPVSLLGHAPSLSLLPLIGWCNSEPNRYLYKYPSNFIPVILLLTPSMKMEQTQCVLNRLHIKFRCRGNTQKKEYNIQNTAKVWNQEYRLYVL